MPGTRLNGWQTAGLITLAVMACYRSLSHAPDSHLIARWWITSAVIALLFLLLPRTRIPLVGGSSLLALVVVGKLAGNSNLFSVGFAVTTVLEAALVGWWLTRGATEQPKMLSWSSFFTWLRAIAFASLVSAALVSALLLIDRDATVWRTFVWIFVTHLAGLSVILPLAMRWPQQEVRVSDLEAASHLGLLAIAVAACGSASENEPVAFLLLPILLWSAARFSSRWTSIELLLTAFGIAALTAANHGPFHELTGQITLLEIAASSQTFVAVSGVAVVAFSVAVAHLRDSLRQNAEHEGQLQQLLDSARGTAFIVTDPNGTITLFSPGAELLLGYTAEEVVGRSTPIPFHDRREIHSRARELGIAPDYRVVTKPLEDGAPQETRDWTYVCKDRSRLSVSLSATAVRDAEGRPIRYLNIVRDISDRRAAEQALVFALAKERETTHRMQEIDRVKDEFISTVSHELRTPLTSIMGYTELLTDGVTGDLNPPQLDLVERIDRNSDRLLRLVEDLLTLARFEHEEAITQQVRTDLRETVESASRQVAFAASRHGVTVRVAMPETPVLLDGDPHDLERLVTNLMDNAVKFSPSGGVVDVNLGIRGDVGRLTVHDNGVGIPGDEQDKLFRRFFRSSISSKLEIQGTGLGLSIVQAVAQAHQGQITFESTPAAGTTFVFTVPLRVTPPVATDPAIPDQPIGVPPPTPTQTPTQTPTPIPDPRPRSHPRRGGGRDRSAVARRFAPACARVSRPTGESGVGDPCRRHNEGASHEVDHHSSDRGRRPGGCRHDLDRDEAQEGPRPARTRRRAALAGCVEHHRAARAGGPCPGGRSRGGAGARPGRQAGGPRPGGAHVLRDDPGPAGGRAADR